MKLTTGRVFFLLLAIWALVWMNAAQFGPVHAGLRFVPPILNYLFFAAAQCIPFAMLSTAERLRDTDRRFGVPLAILLCVVALPGACTASSCIVLGGARLDTNDAFENYHDLSAPSGKVVVYRTNGGALTDFGIEVRQECTIVPGILIVERPLTGAYPAYDAELSLVAADVVRITIHSDPPSTTDVKLRRWPCIAGG